MPITVACDGSALGNPGPAGWAWYIDNNRWAAGGWPNATNNRGELQAVIEALKATAHTREDVHVLADSKYVINAVTKWMPVWKRNNWKKKGGGEVLNRDQMEEIGALVDALEKAGRKLTFEWVKGHADHALNEAADQRARAAAQAYQTGAEVPAGPGFAAPSAGAKPGANTAGSAGGEDLKVGTEAQAVRVWCDVEPQLAQQIVAEARALKRTPHQHLAELIRKGLNA